MAIWQVAKKLTAAIMVVTGVVSWFGENAFRWMKQRRYKPVNHDAPREHKTETNHQKERDPGGPHDRGY